MSVEKNLFGMSEGEKIYRYKVRTEDISAEFCEIGASIMSLVVKNSEGQETDVVLGIDILSAFRRNWPAFGAVIGRCANRINGAKFMLDGVEYKLKKNIKGGCLHSGDSYHYRRWESEVIVTEGEENGVAFWLKSPDGDQGYPGTLDVRVEYTLVNTALRIKYSYRSDKATPVNLTNHCYFNLEGHNSGNVLEHQLCVNSKYVTQVDRKLMPTGKILDVTDSAFDFQEKRMIRSNMLRKFTPYSCEKQYDINYALAYDRDYVAEDGLRHAATLESPSGRLGMRVYTDMPGMQLYTGNAIGGITGKNGAKYEKYSGICFETQFYPDAVNIAEFPSPVIEKDKQVETTTIFDFYTDL